MQKNDIWLVFRNVKNMSITYHLVDFSKCQKYVKILPKICYLVDFSKTQKYVKSMSKTCRRHVKSMLLALELGPGNTTIGSHCGSASKASRAGSAEVRAQPKAKVSCTTSAISQPVLLGLSASISAMIKHMPEAVARFGRSAQMQWLGLSRQPEQRSDFMPPRAKNGLLERAKRASRRRETA